MEYSSIIEPAILLPNNRYALGVAKQMEINEISMVSG